MLFPMSHSMTKVTLLGIAMLFCSACTEEQTTWHNAYDIENELHLLTQEIDRQVIFARLQEIHQTLPLYIQREQQIASLEGEMAKWLVTLNTSLRNAPLHHATIENCESWRHAMEVSWQQELSLLNERAKEVWRVMLATCKA